MNEKTNSAVSAFEAAMAASGSKVTYSGAGAAVAGGLSSNDLVAIIGLLIAAAGFLVNLYYRRKEDRRQAALHEAKMAEMGLYE